MKFLLIHENRRYTGETIEEVRAQLVDCGYSYQYAKDLANKAIGDPRPLTLEWVGGPTKPWLLNDVRVNEKTALFDLEFHGFPHEVAQAILAANRLCAEVDQTTKQIKQTCKNIERDFKSWLLRRKSGSAQSVDIAAE